MVAEKLQSKHETKIGKSLKVCVCLCVVNKAFFNKYIKLNTFLLVFLYFSSTETFSSSSSFQDNFIKRKMS